MDDETTKGGGMQYAVSIIPTEAILDKRLSDVDVRVLLALGTYPSGTQLSRAERQWLAKALHIRMKTLEVSLVTLGIFGYTEKWEPEA